MALVVIANCIRSEFLYNSHILLEVENKCRSLLLGVRGRLELCVEFDRQITQLMSLTFQAPVY